MSSRSQWALDCRQNDVPGLTPPQLRRLVVVPFATLGVLAAVLTWEIEHVGSILLSLAIVAGGIVVGVVVARQLREDIDRVTDRYEALLRTADAESRRAESANRVKDELLATLSHELRTPLNSILGWTRLLASGKLDHTQTARAIQAIERAGWSQSRLIENLLDMSRMIEGKLQLVPRATAMQPLIQSTVDGLRTAADAKHLELAVSVDPTLGSVNVDPDRLQQVVWNLVSNAIKFTRPGGSVAVSLRSEGEQMILTVQDSGIGLRPDVAAHLFEHFRQGDSSSTREHGGLGLGLGIVRHIVELHGGTVHATSKGEQQGSTFQVRLPVQRAEAAPAAAPPIEPHAPLLRGVKVLIVDDDPLGLNFARATLEQSGARVITAGGAHDAREKFASEHPDVIVCDLRMPDEDGFQFIREIRRLEEPARVHTPAVALTALARGSDRRHALAAGYQLHMAKPVDPDELVQTIERLARRGKTPAARAS